MKDSTYPRLQEHLRSGCDLGTACLFLDDCSNVAHKDNVQVMTGIMLDILRNPHTPRPKDEWVGGEVIRQ
jgi:hypothetical protein